MAVKVAINGFGRIGKDMVRAHFEGEYENMELVAINDPSDVEEMARLLRHDSIYRAYKGEIEVDGDDLIIDGNRIKTYSDRNPENLPWEELGVELVIDATGAFRDREGLSKHIKAGAKKVLLTAPGKDMDVTIVCGVNEEDYDAEKHDIVSNASCTTNCLAPVAKVISDEFGVKKGLMTTIHAYTNDQRLLDSSHSDPRRARAAATNMIPTTTGAAKAVSLVLPELEGKLDGFAVRVPTPTVSLVDVVFEVEKDTTVEEVNKAFKAASEGSMKGILGFSEEPLVSSDYIGDKRSSIVDADLTSVIEGNLVKVVAWYDNEWGYSERVLQLARIMIDKGI